MYMRTVSFRIDPAMLEKFRGEADGARTKFRAIAGLQHQYTGVSADGGCLAVGIWESAEAAEKGQDEAMAVLQALSHYLVAPPQAIEYPAVESGT